MKALLVALVLVASVAANPLPKNEDNQEDWQLVPDASGKMHMVDTKSSDVDEIGPSFVGMQDMVFRLFTRSNLNTPQIIRINNPGDLAASFFNPQRQTRYMIHGWLGGGDGDNGLPIMRSFLNYGDFNFFMVDWSIGAETINYIVARGRVNEVGTVVARFVDFTGQNTNLVSVMGHSLGAHAAGATGKRTTGRLSSVVGLDPGGPLFSLDVPADRIDHTDANHVEIHITDAGRLGFPHPVGHANFYPNWGTSQPGCGTDITGQCGHSLVRDFFAESINPARVFGAIRCRNLDDIRQRNCVVSGVSRRMGGEPILDGTSPPGSVFFLTTNAQAPFAQGPR
ncbi:lipase member H-A-like [Bradysia coprophila]|uniref:lipase member H-A-like n=1 Tax=Bradysia coprophila TaxID=38358 RepID=UPI00187D854E|nr:lipase member H-A-like [Bradysia coprophila]